MLIGAVCKVGLYRTYRDKT